MCLVVARGSLSVLRESDSPTFEVSELYAFLFKVGSQLMSGRQLSWHRGPE
jgi:hypothetical protein